MPTVLPTHIILALQPPQTPPLRMTSLLLLLGGTAVPVLGLGAVAVPAPVLA
jgi:hypothetical protein